MTNGYEKVRQDIAGQRGQIAERRRSLAKSVVGGSAKQRRISMRRVVRTPEHRSYVKAKKEELSALGSAEAELAEYETKVAEYETEGYTVKQTDKGLQFSKTIRKKKTSSRFSGPARMVRWVDSSGKSKTTHAYASNVGTVVKQIQGWGGSIVKIQGQGSGVPGSGKVYYEAKTVYETIAPMQTGKQLGELTVHHIGMDKKLDLGFGKQKRVGEPTSDAELAMIRQSDISRLDVTKELTQERITRYEAMKDMPDMMEWTNKEMAKIKRAYEINPVLGGVAELGFGITTSFASLGKPVFTSLTGKQLPHYVTWFDVPFGEGRGAELLGKHPIYAGGSVVGEAAQVIAFWGAGHAAKTGIVSGTKFFVRKTPRFLGKLKTFTGVSRPLLQSEAMLFEGGFKVIGRKPTLLTKTFGKVETFGRTPFWRNIAGWSEGKLVFAKAYPVVKGYPKIYHGKDVYVKITKYKGFGKRVLEIPKVVKQEQVGSALTIQFLGTHKGKLSRSIIYRSIYKPKGLFRKEIKQVFISSHRGPQYQKITESTGGHFIRPFLSEEAKRIPAIKITQKGFIKSMDASAQLVPTVTIPHHVSSTSFGHVGSLGREPLILSISQMPLSSFMVTPIVISGVRSISLSKQIQMNVQREELSYKQRIDTKQIQKSLPSYAQINMQVNQTIQKQQQKQAQSYKLLTKQTYQPMDKTFKRYFKAARGTVVKPPIFIPFDFPDFEGKVKKRRKKQLDDLSKGYRFRRWKVPTMKQIIGIKI